MSTLNLGTAAFEAVSNLKHNQDWRQWVDALHNQASLLMHRAIEALPTERLDNCGYARALRDLVAHIEQIENPRPGNQQPKPAVRPRPRDD